jgi:hypothetical protein
MLKEVEIYTSSVIIVEPRVMNIIKNIRKIIGVFMKKIRVVVDNVLRIHFVFTIEEKEIVENVMDRRSVNIK